MEENRGTDVQNDIPPIRTFQSDIAEALKTQKGSVIKIAVQEQQKRQDQASYTEVQKKSNVYFLVGGILFFILALGFLAYYYMNVRPLQKENEQITTLTKKRNFVSGDHVTPLVITDINALPTLLATQESALSLPVGAIEQFLFTYKDSAGVSSIVPLEEVFTQFRITPPSEFLYSLVPDTYLFGMYQTTTQNRFLLLKTKVFSNTFSQMLAWESALAENFALLFKIPLDPQVPIVFKDVIIKNEDVRVGYAKDTQVIAYSFFGHKKELLLITKDTETMQTLLNRFTKKLLEQ